jgi:8-oxo-dGTP pyrophosphatase MutT (NUDIX family)
MSWRTESSRSVYENRWIAVREDGVSGPAGAGIYGVVRMQHPAVFVVAVDTHGRVCLVALERYPTGTRSIEVPAGGTDGESPREAAERELREETGLRAGELTEIGFMYALNGIADAPEHVFLATGLEPVPGAHATDRHEEGIDEVSWVPFPEVLGMIRDRQITDGETIAALMFAAIHLGRVS